MHYNKIPIYPIFYLLKEGLQGLGPRYIEIAVYKDRCEQLQQQVAAKATENQSLLVDSATHKDLIRWIVKSCMMLSNP